MSKDITFTIYGLENDKGDVDAEIFVKKLQNFLNGLKNADKLENENQQQWRYVITDLTHSSAVACLKEVNKNRKYSNPVSGIETFYRKINDVYNGYKGFNDKDIKIIKNIKSLTNGAGDKFAHAEIIKHDNEIIRIDDFLNKRAIEAEKYIISQSKKSTLYKGISIVELDGVLNEIDARSGSILKGIITLTAGDIQLECTLKQSELNTIKDNFNKRSLIQGTAHYDGESSLPVRVDIINIKPIKENKDGLDKWRGAFKDNNDRIEDLDW